MGLTTDRNNPCLSVTLDNGQQACHLVLSEEERNKGFVRPLRRSYIHVGRPGPKYSLRDLSLEEHDRYDKYKYIKYEKYPDDSTASGRFWTQEQFDKINKGCQQITTMALALCETYSTNPKFYGATFCSSCRDYYPVGSDGEFIWSEDGERVGS